MSRFIVRYRSSEGFTIAPEWSGPFEPITGAKLYALETDGGNELLDYTTGSTFVMYSETVATGDLLRIRIEDEYHVRTDRSTVVFAVPCGSSRCRFRSCVTVSTSDGSTVRVDASECPRWHDTVYADDVHTTRRKVRHTGYRYGTWFDEKVSEVTRHVVIVDANREPVTTVSFVDDSRLCLAGIRARAVETFHANQSYSMSFAR